LKSNAHGYVNVFAFYSNVHPLIIKKRKKISGRSSKSWIKNIRERIEIQSTVFTEKHKLIDKDYFVFSIDCRKLREN
jgi:hypothetical protein